MLKKLLPTLLPYLLELGLARKQTPKRLGLYAIGAGFIGVAAIFALIALHQALSALCGTMATNLYFAAGFLVIGGLAILIAWLWKRQQRKNDPLAHLEEYFALAQETFDDMQKNVTEFTEKHSGKILLGTAIAAFILGKSARKK